VSGPRIAVVDYGMGNRRSVHKALERAGARTETTRAPAALQAADGLVLPGVGAFPEAMRRLRELGLAELLAERIGEGAPLLGICLGMQLLFERSEEHGVCAGLGLIEGEVKRLRTRGLRIPHIGWSEVRFERPSPLFEGLPAAGCPFYHVHSFAAHPREAGVVLASASYGERFATAVASGNVFGVQFHPEKSSLHGLRLLENFAALCAAPVGAR
jgi:glutamine amidotransferase